MENTNAQPPEIPDRIREVHTYATELQWRIAREVEAAINKSYAGQSPESIALKKAIISFIRQLLRQHALRVLCPRCNRAADIYVASSPSRRGSIRYRHTGQGKPADHGGKVAIQPFTLVPQAAIDTHGYIATAEATLPLAKKPADSDDPDDGQQFQI